MIKLCRGAKRTWRKDASTSSEKKVFKSFSGGDSGTNFNTFNPPIQNSMVSFRGGGDSSGAFNVGSSVTLDGVGWRQNNSLVSTATDVRTSTSIAPTNLAELLMGDSMVSNEETDSHYISSNSDLDRNKKLVHFSSSSSADFGPRSGIGSGSGKNNLDQSIQNLTIAEPKELPATRLKCDFSSNIFHSRDRENFANQIIVENIQIENEVQLVDININIDTDNGEDNEEKELHSADMIKQTDHCPYYLSDDGAFVFSTN